MHLLQRQTPAALAPLVAKRSEVAGIERQLGSLEAQLRSIVEDQQRLRENMKALRGSEEEKALTQRYTKQLGDQEDRLAALRDDVKKAAADRDARRRELADLAGKLAFEI